MKFQSYFNAPLEGMSNVCDMTKEFSVNIEDKIVEKIIENYNSPISGISSYNFAGVFL